MLELRYLKATVKGQLLHDVEQMTFDGVSREVEPLRYFLVAETVGDENNDFALTVRESRRAEAFSFHNPGGQAHKMRKD